MKTGMKKRWFFLTLVVLLGVISVLAEGAAQPEPEGLRLYYPYRTESEERRDSAIGREHYQGPVGEDPGEFPGPRVLLDTLLAGPVDPELESPFPKGVAIENWRWDPEREGNLQIRLSEPYSGLTDIALTLADYCIVLTMSQIPRVKTVEITSTGHASSYHSRQIRGAEEVLLTDSMAAGGALS